MQDDDDIWVGRSDESLSRSKDESDFPKYLNIKFDFCDVDGIPESEDDENVKFS